MTAEALNIRPEILDRPHPAAQRTGSTLTRTQSHQFSLRETLTPLSEILGQPHPYHPKPGSPDMIPHQTHQDAPESIQTPKMTRHSHSHVCVDPERSQTPQTRSWHLDQNADLESVWPGNSVVLPRTSTERHTPAQGRLSRARTREAFPCENRGGSMKGDAKHGRYYLLIHETPPF